jgi:hypothetical protein
MQRQTFARVPIISTAVLSLPPMHAWPTPLKRVVLGVCVVMCLVAYVAMAAGLLGLASVMLGLI